MSLKKYVFYLIIFSLPVLATKPSGQPSGGWLATGLRTAVTGVSLLFRRPPPVVVPREGAPTPPPAAVVTPENPIARLQTEILTWSSHWATATQVQVQNYRTQLEALGQQQINMSTLGETLDLLNSIEIWVTVRSFLLDGNSADWRPVGTRLQSLEDSYLIGQNRAIDAILGSSRSGYNAIASMNRSTSDLERYMARLNVFRSPILAAIVPSELLASFEGTLLDSLQRLLSEVRALDYEGPLRVYQSRFGLIQQAFDLRRALKGADSFNADEIDNAMRSLKFELDDSVSYRTRQFNSLQKSLSDVLKTGGRVDFDMDLKPLLLGLRDIVGEHNENKQFFSEDTWRRVEEFRIKLDSLCILDEETTIRDELLKSEKCDREDCYAPWNEYVILLYNERYRALELLDRNRRFSNDDDDYASSRERRIQGLLDILRDFARDFRRGFLQTSPEFQEQVESELVELVNERRFEEERHSFEKEKRRRQQAAEEKQRKQQEAAERFRNQRASTSNYEQKQWRQQTVEDDDVDDDDAVPPPSYPLPESMPDTQLRGEIVQTIQTILLRDNGESKFDLKNERGLKLAFYQVLLATHPDKNINLPEKERLRMEEVLKRFLSVWSEFKRRQISPS